MSKKLLIDGILTIVLLPILLFCLWYFILPTTMFLIVVIIISIVGICLGIYEIIKYFKQK